ncbi:VanZ family protein [Priestia abyssalis]|uniref:VanZ family protein n=1 Tax=Priestia abyssalis TaxID=1221450 RepID=UPI000995D230|nr:VanZ family protein [Priestia abyssalis]
MDANNIRITRLQGTRSELIKQERRKKRIRLLLVLVWVLFLSVNTWVENLGALLSLHSIRFTWVSSPDFSSFFHFADLTEIHNSWFLIKFGHFIGFAILNLLLYFWLKNHRMSIVIAVMYAIFTEVIQLFVGRDGRLYDLMIDSLGIATEYYLLKKLNILK